MVSWRARSHHKNGQLNLPGLVTATGTPQVHKPMQLTRENDAEPAAQCTISQTASKEGQQTTRPNQSEPPHNTSNKLNMKETKSQVKQHNRQTRSNDDKRIADQRASHSVRVSDSDHGHSEDRRDTEIIAYKLISCPPHQQITIGRIEDNQQPRTRFTTSQTTRKQARDQTKPRSYKPNEATRNYQWEKFLTQ